MTLLPADTIAMLDRQKMHALQNCTEIDCINVAGLMQDSAEKVRMHQLQHNGAKTCPRAGNSIDITSK